MNELSWFKCWRGFNRHPKILALKAMAKGKSFCFVWLECLDQAMAGHGEQGQLWIAEGVPMTAAVLGKLAGETTETAEQAIEAMIGLDMLSRDACGIISVCNFAKEKPKTSTERVRRFRARKKLEAEHLGGAI